MANIIHSDDVHQSFSNREELLRRLEEVELNTIWTSRNVKSISVKDTANIADSNLLQNDDYLIHTHTDGTGLVLYLDGKAIGIRECAKPSLYARLGLGGPILDWLDQSGIQKICQTGVNYVPNKGIKIATTEGKVNAFLSAQYDESISAATVFKEMDNYISSVAKDQKVIFDADWSYAQTVANYILPLEKEIEGRKYRVGITLATSDAGYSGANFRAFLTGNGYTNIPLMSSIGIVHKGRKGTIKLSETISMLDKAVDGGLRKLNRLFAVTINNPKATMKRVAKEVKLPKKEALELIDKFEVEGSCSAFACYMCLAQILNSKEGTIASRQERIGNVAKMIGINWTGYDLAGDFAW